MDKMRLRDALLDFFFPCGECLSCGSMAKVRNGLCEKCRENCAPRPQADGRALVGSTICAVSMLTTVRRGS